MTRTLATAGLLAVLGGQGTARGANDNRREYIGYGVEEFSTECAGNDLVRTIDEAVNLQLVFLDWSLTGDWGEQIILGDLNVDGQDFTDQAKPGSTCDDPDGGGCNKSAADEVEDAGCDSADVCLVSTHGSESSTTYRFATGDDENDCKVDAADDWLWGNQGAARPHGDLEVLIVDACHSGNYDVFDTSDPGIPSGVFEMVDDTSTFSTYLGYHGTAPDRSLFITNYGFASYEDGIGLNWLLEAVQFDILPNEDTCPVAIVFGDTFDLREHMYEWGGFDDREDTGLRTTNATYWFFLSCDPGNANPLPSS